jgi:hypothetical protein
MTISYWDQDYIRTKRIKLGQAEMEPLFKELANWIAAEFACPVPLNVEFEWVELVSLPRLQVVFERKTDARSFRDELGNTDLAKRDRVTRQFLDLLLKYGDDGFDTDGMFVIFTAFEPTARWEANSAMNYKRLAEVRNKLDSPMIWLIYPQFETVTFFLHTDAQLAMTEGQPFRQQCQEAYMEALRPFDEMGYFAESPMVPLFESKEGFERDYGGSWQSYMRR